MNRKHCYPLTITDACSRFVFPCEPLDDGQWHLWFGPVFLGRIREVGRNKLLLQKEMPRKIT